MAMTEQDWAKVLTLLQLGDARFTWDRDTVSAWRFVFADTDLDPEWACAAARDLLRAGRYGVTPAAFQDALEPYRAQNRGLVRSARERGLVPRDWPVDRLLPRRIVEQVRALRAADAAAHLDDAEDVYRLAGIPAEVRAAMPELKTVDDALDEGSGS